MTSDQKRLRKVIKRNKLQSLDFDAIGMLSRTFDLAGAGVELIGAGVELVGAGTEPTQKKLRN